MTTWMDPDGIMLGEISQRERQYCVVLLITWKLKTNTKNQIHGKRYQICGYQRQKSGGHGEGELEEGGPKLLASGYKIKKYQRCNVQHDGYSCTAV